MKRIAIWAMALTLTLGLFAPGVASAHVKIFPTSTTLGTSATKITKGQRVTFSGKIVTGKKKCKARQRIRITRNGNFFSKTTTNGRGKYSVTRKVAKKGRYRAVFNGFTFGVHPHSHTCQGSTSPPVRIRMK